MNRIRFFRPSLLALALAALPSAAPATAQTMVQTTSDADRLADQVRVLAADPRNVNALVEAGRLSVQLNDMAAAMAFFARAETVEPGNPRIAAGRAGALVRAGRPGEALRLFAIAESRGLPPVDYAADRGLAYDLMGVPLAAQRDYKLALTRSRDDELVRRYALSLGVSGQREEAMTQLDPLLRRGDRAAWRARAFILAMNNDIPGAERIASSMMPGAMGQSMSPFFRKLATLGQADRAFAVHFGEVSSSPARVADARMAPPLPHITPPPATVPVQATAATAPQPAIVPIRKGAHGRGNQLAAQTSRLAIVPAPAPARRVDDDLPPPPAAATQIAMAPSVPMVQPTPGAMAMPQRAMPAPVAPPLRAAGTTLPPHVVPPMTLHAMPAQPPAARLAPAMPAPAPAAAVPSPAPAPAAPVALPAAVVSAPPPPVSPPASVPLSQPVPASPVAAPPAVAPAPPPVSQSTAAPGFSEAVAGPVDSPSAPSFPATTAAPPPLPAAAPTATPSAPAVERPANRVGAEDATLADIMRGIPTEAPPLATVTPASTPMAAAPAPAPAPVRAAPPPPVVKKPASVEAVATKADPKLAKPDPKAAKPDPKLDPKAAKLDPRTGKPDSRALAKLDPKTGKPDPKGAKSDPKKPAKPDPAKTEPARVWVQVAGGANVDTLPGAWSKVVAQAPAAFKGRAAWTTPLRATNRVLTGPFKTAAEAQTFVNALRKQGVEAFAFTSEPGQKVTKLGAK